MQFGKQYREVKLRYVYLFLHSFEETCLYGRLYFKENRRNTRNKNTLQKMQCQ